MYYEQVEKKLGDIFKGIEEAYKDSSSTPLAALKEYFAYLISQSIFQDFIEAQKQNLLSSKVIAKDLPAFAFLWLAFYIGCTKRGREGVIEETDPAGCRDLDRLGLSPLNWLSGVLLAFFHQYRPYEWGQDLREGEMFSRLERFHHSTLAHVNRVTAELYILSDKDRPLMRHLAIREIEKDKKIAKQYYLLLKEEFSAHFRYQVQINPTEYRFINLMFSGPKDCTREELASKVSEAKDGNQAKDRVSALKGKINSYCRNAGLSDLIVGKKSYLIATLSIREQNLSNSS